MGFDVDIPDTSEFLKHDGSVAMTGALAMGNNNINIGTGGRLYCCSLHSPTGPISLHGTDIEMNAKINMFNAKIINLKNGTAATDAAAYGQLP